MALATLRRKLFGKPLDPLDTRDAPLHRARRLLRLGRPRRGRPLVARATAPKRRSARSATHTHLGLYLAVATAVTVFIIALAYNQVIELFPTGGGGYRVADQACSGPMPGLVAGAALILDYVLTIAISIASGVDALLRCCRSASSPTSCAAEVALIGVLIVLNLRGMKEAIKVLLPIFLGFVVTHAGPDRLRHLRARASTCRRWCRRRWPRLTQLASQIGWTGVAGTAAARVLAGRRHLHRHRSGSNNVNIARRAARAHRQDDDALHGAVAGLHRRRHHPALPAVGREARRRRDAQRGDVRLHHRQLRPRQRPWRTSWC